MVAGASPIPVLGIAFSGKNVAVSKGSGLDVGYVASRLRSTHRLLERKFGADSLRNTRGPSTLGRRGYDPDMQPLAATRALRVVHPAFLA